MTTISTKLSPAVAKQFAKAADILEMTHEEAAAEAIKLFARSISPTASKKRKK